MKSGRPDAGRPAWIGELTVPLSSRGTQHILAMRKRAMTGRTKTIVLVSQLSAPTGLANPAAPVITDAGAGGTFPGGTVYAVCVAKNATGATRAGSEAGPVAIPANHLVQIQPVAQAGATSFDVYVGLTPANEAFAATVPSGVPLTISAPLAAGAPAPYNSYTAVQGIFRHERGINSTDLDESGSGGDRRLMEVLLELAIDINLDGITMVADTPTPTATAVAAAEKFIFIDLVTAGIVPGGDRWLAMMRRIR